LTLRLPSRLGLALRYPFVIPEGVEFIPRRP
jgi:hypothetical protein